MVSFNVAVCIDLIWLKFVPPTPEALEIRYSYGPNAGIVSSFRGFFHPINITPLTASVFVTLTFLIIGIPDTSVEVISFDALLSSPFGNTATIR